MVSHKGLWKGEGQHANNGELGSEGKKARENMQLGRSQQRHKQHCQEVGSCSESRGSGSQWSNVIFIWCLI